MPENHIAPRQQIAASCRQRGQNSFTVSGRGGLPTNPTYTIGGQTVWQYVRNIL
ncbi:MAG: hypothetical protein HRU34_19850 [Richelia sp.]|nr:hypothetical protein [Richelia sp.]